MFSTLADLHIDKYYFRNLRNQNNLHLYLKTLSLITSLIQEFSTLNFSEIDFLLKECLKYLPRPFDSYAALFD